MMMPGLVQAADASPCTHGTAQALFQNLPIGGFLELRGHVRPRLVEAFNECQYRVFRDGDEVTFNEDNVFVGGILWFYDFKAAGVTRPAAIADIEMNVDRVWLAEVLPGGELGPLVEQPLMRTVYWDVQHVFFGQVVYQHRAFYNAASTEGLREHFGEQLSGTTG